MRSELYFIHRWHERNTTRTDRSMSILIVRPRLAKWQTRPAREYHHHGCNGFRFESGCVAALSAYSNYNTTRNQRAVVRIRRTMRTLATSGEMRATAGASHPGRKTGTRRRE